LQARDYFVTQCFNLFVVRGSTRLKISFCPRTPCCVWITFVSQSVVGKALPQMCGQTPVRWIHEHGSSVLSGVPSWNPTRGAEDFLKLVKGEGLHICHILETQAHSDFVSGTMKEFFSFS
jgi:hypothetical protein